MEIFTKILLVLCFLALMIIALGNADESLGKIMSPRKQRLLRALLYAAIFTPTAYHHAPNTIVLPFHLSTICGNLFYGYDYTTSMFIYGVLTPIAFSFIVIWATLTIKDQKKSPPARKAI